MTQHYSNPARESDPHALPDIETFYVDPTDIQEAAKGAGPIDSSIERLTEPGWYWWTCSPGYMPDSDPCGPFATEAEALADAREGIADDDEPCEPQHAVECQKCHATYTQQGKAPYCCGACGSRLINITTPSCAGHEGNRS